MPTHESAARQMRRRWRYGLSQLIGRPEPRCKGKSDGSHADDVRNGETTSRNGVTAIRHPRRRQVLSHGNRPTGLGRRQRWSASEVPGIDRTDAIDADPDQGLRRSGPKKTRCRLPQFSVAWFPPIPEAARLVRSLASAPSFPVVGLLVRLQGRHCRRDDFPAGLGDAFTHLRSISSACCTRTRWWAAQTVPISQRGLLTAVSGDYTLRHCSATRSRR